MIYGYVAIKNRIKCDIDTDYQEEAVAEVKKVRLFLDEKERDESARINYQNSGSCSIPRNSLRNLNRAI